MGRNRHQCHYDGCDSTAEWELHMRLWYKGIDGRPLPLDMKASAQVCGRHRVACIASLTTENQKTMIAGQLKRLNLPKPDFNSMTIECRPIERPLTAIEIAMLPKSRIIQCGQMEGVGEAQAQCAMPAQWQTVLKMRNIGQNRTHRPTQLLMNLCVCNKHRQSLKPEDFTDLKTRSMLTGALAEMGLTLPDWKTLELDFEEMKGGKPVDPADFARVRA